MTAWDLYGGAGVFAAVRGDNSAAFAAQLRAHGVLAGDRVVLAVNPSLEYIAALYGIMQLGAVPVPCFPSAPLTLLTRHLPGLV